MSFKSEQKSDDDAKLLEETLNTILSNDWLTFEPPLKHPQQAVIQPILCMDPSADTELITSPNNACVWIKVFLYMIKMPHRYSVAFGLRNVRYSWNSNSAT